VERPSALIAVDDALQALEAIDARKAKLAEMRFLGGLTAEESAGVQNLPVEKVRASCAWRRRGCNANWIGEPPESSPTREKKIFQNPPRFFALPITESENKITVSSDSEDD
jgi:hypothetical protein